MANSPYYGTLSSQQETGLGTGRVHIEDFVTRYPRKKFNILQRWNGKIFEKPVDGTKYQWNEENLRPTKDLLAQAISSTTATTVVASTAGIFNAYDVIKIDSEFMLVQSINSDGVTMTVVRGWGGTTATTHSTGSTSFIYRNSVAFMEGNDAGTAVTQPLSLLYNYTQVFADTVSLSVTEENSRVYRVNEGNSYASSLIIAKHKELAEMLQNSLLTGIAAQDSTGKQRTMGGLKWFIDTYASANAIDLGGSTSWTTADSTTSLSGNNISVAQQKLDDLIQQLVYNRSTPTAIYAGYKAMRRIKEWAYDKIRIDQNDKTRGVSMPLTYLSQAGELELVLVEGDALNDLIMVVDETRVGYKNFEGEAWYTEELATTGHAHKWFIAGEYTCAVKTPAVHGYLYDLGL